MRRHGHCSELFFSASSAVLGTPQNNQKHSKGEGKHYHSYHNIHIVYTRYLVLFYVPNTKTNRKNSQRNSSLKSFRS